MFDSRAEFAGNQTGSRYRYGQLRDVGKVRIYKRRCGESYLEGNFGNIRD